MTDYPTKTYYVAKRTSNGKYIINMDLIAPVWSLDRVRAFDNGCFWDSLEHAKQDVLRWKDVYDIDIELESVRIELTPDE